MRTTHVPLAAALALFASVCACMPRETRPSAMGADEHRDAAVEHRARAAEEERQYDPADTALRPVPGPMIASPRGEPLAQEPLLLEEYNPTAHHESAAARERAEAQAHERAAVKLEKLEDDACAAVPAGTRASCPLFGTVLAVEPYIGGARVKLKDASTAPALVARMRCHAAFAAKLNKEERASLVDCPLYVDELKVDLDGDWIILRSSAPGAPEQLRALLRQHLAAPAH